VAPIVYVASSLALSAVVMARVPAVRQAIDTLTSHVPQVGADSRWWQDNQDARTQSSRTGTCEEDVPSLEDLILYITSTRIPAASHLVYEGGHGATRP
jgi:hypothetical protein